MEPKPGKRMVSKREYVANVSKKTLASTMAMALFILGLMGFLVGLLLLFMLMGNRFMFTFMLMGNTGIHARLVKTLLCLCVAVIGVVICKYGYEVLEHVSQIESGVPLTRANTADLPAPDSLVRASEEPMQDQQAVLLRAAAEGQETPPEQLVRASVSFSVSRSGRPGQE